ncbi:MAG: maleate cis-trans isomerase family protein [Sciscionella sp.]
MTARMTVGFLYPGHAAEDDYPRMQRMLSDSVRLAVEHTYGEDLHAVEALLELGSTARLAEGVTRLARHDPDAVVWACTSGSFVFGPDGAAEQVAKLSEAAGVPASSTSFAFARAAKSLGLRTVAVAASYPAEVAERFVSFLAHEGLEVTGLSSEGIVTAAEVGQLPEESVLQLARAHDHPEADALLIPDTAMRTVALIEKIEAELGKPVLTANQVTLWEGLRLVDSMRPVPGLGALFAGRRE